MLKLKKIYTNVCFIYNLFEKPRAAMEVMIVFTPLSPDHKLIKLSLLFSGDNGSIGL